MSQSLISGEGITLRNGIFSRVNGNVFPPIVEEVRTLGSRVGAKGRFPTWRTPSPENPIGPYGNGDGWMFAAEAAGYKILWTEASLLLQSHGISDEMSRAVKEILGKPELYPFAVATGISVFGEHVRGALSIRDLADAPTGRSLGDVMKRRNYERFAPAFAKDRGMLGNYVMMAVMTDIVEEAAKPDSSFFHDALSGSTKEDLRTRQESFAHGAKIARDLYLEAQASAAQHLGGFQLP